MIGFLINNWLLPSYIVTDQNAFTGGNSPAGESDRVVVLAAVERLTGPVCSSIGVHGFYGIVAIKTAFGCTGTHQPIAVVESLITEERTDVPAVDVLHSARQKFVYLVVTLLKRHQYLGLVQERQIFELEGLAGPDADLRKFRTDCLVP